MGECDMVRAFWLWLVYSFFGFLLEKVFAFVTRSDNQDRKCFLFLPLCPVYGFGVLAILSLPQAVLQHPAALFLYGALVSTAVEYGVDLAYDRLLHVRFWNYEGMPGNLRGRVCLLFSFFWGFLSLPLVNLVHPRIADLPQPTFLLPVAFCLLAADGLVSAVLLRRHRTPAILCWYDRRARGRV